MQDRHVRETSVDLTGSFDSTAALAQQALNQDGGAFATLVERYHNFVFQICYRILGHRQDAEDATQDTFSRVARYLHRWDKGRPFEPWLATVAGNRSRSQLARRRSHRSLNSISEPQTLSTSQDHAAEAMREEISLALSNLPPRQRTAFELFHEQSLPYAEIAERMDCPVGTVKTLVHRARQSLIEQLRQRRVLPTPQQSADSLGGAS